MVQKRKLIEVALPLEAINRESAREKSIRHGHPSTLHLWWARRPLAAARAVLFAQLVDDPSSRPEEFPTEELQRAERERLHALIERLVVWENIRDKKLLAEAHVEILKSTDCNPPPILDPFAGGGTIPLEAQRLGLEAHASDLNPVAVLITKALIEIPPKFAGLPPVFPEAADAKLGAWPNATGIAEDVARYGTWMRDEAERRIAQIYPKAVLPDGSKATAIAWVWARTVTCPNPACGIQMPLVRSWWLGKKKGKEAYVVPTVVRDAQGRHVEFSIGRDPKKAPATGNDGTVGRTGAVCIACGTSVPLAYVRTQGRDHRLGQQLMAIVTEGHRSRTYLAPTQLQADAAVVARPENAPVSDMPPANAALSFRVQAYGMTHHADLFTNRQLVALTTFSELVSEARSHALDAARSAGMPTGERLAAGGTGAEAYADAIAVYLTLGVSRMADNSSSLTRWSAAPAHELVVNTFNRQALPMVWDFGEANPFYPGNADYAKNIGWISRAIGNLPASGTNRVAQADASTRNYGKLLVSTDPPYYDNIGYSDLSDYFYVWLRGPLKEIYPDLFRTILVPKAEELVANAHRHGGKSEAEHFFEDGFRDVFARVRQADGVDSPSSEFPITVYYAFKQSDTRADETASTGWETLLEGMIRSGWEITSTWPMRTEMSSRMVASGTNALASSIVLSLRPRNTSAGQVDRRGFIASLEAELPDALRRLQQGSIAPVDLPQAAIGPGMTVFSRYSAVLETDGRKMTVRSALARINEILDQVLNEQEGDFDAPSRFAIAWYRQHGYHVGPFGDANSLANARNTTVDVMDRDGILTSRAGKVQLIRPADLSWDYDPIVDTHTSIWEALHHLVKVLEREGIAPAGGFLQSALNRPDGAVDADLVKELAHLLFRIAEGNSWTKDALSFNSLVTSWPEILEVARSAKTPHSAQGAFDFDEDD